MVNLIDTVYALMVFPTLSATLLLAPRVLSEAADYFARQQQAG